MTCFQTVINKLGLNSDSQENFADLAYVLLSALDAKEQALGAALAGQTPAASLPADTYANPFKEVLYRLSSWKNSFGYRHLADLFGDLTN